MGTAVADQDEEDDAEYELEDTSEVEEFGILEKAHGDSLARLSGLVCVAVLARGPQSKKCFVIRLWRRTSKGNLTICKREKISSRNKSAGAGEKCQPSYSWQSNTA